MAAKSGEIRGLVEQTPFIDTHEHLIEEKTRLAGPEKCLQPRRALKDFSVLFSHYADSDLRSAGMSVAEEERFFSVDLGPREKWAIIEPYYERARGTGYLLNVRESVRMLYDHDDLSAGNIEELSRQVAAGVTPGYYRPIINRVANIECCHVNSLEGPPLMETQYPDLLYQDLSIVALSTGLLGFDAARRLGREVGSLDDWYGVIDATFETWAPKAIALKSQAAYERRLDYHDVPAETAAPLFARLARGAELTAAEYKCVQDHLFNVCLGKAREYHLPVKLHTGYYAGVGRMPLGRLMHNGADVSELLIRYPDVDFVIMHITYPFQDEAIALAKHFPNAYVDLCWAWIINPPAGVRFLKEFLMAAPANKLLTFGGDYAPVELVPGHARIARRGIAQALEELVDEGWLEADRIPALVPRLMRGTALELFDHKAALAAWD